ncbi:MAG: hypothetical protein RSE62_12820 [Citrobacter sp.]
MKTSREQFEEWFPDMVTGIPENMVKVFDEMLFLAWQASRECLEIEMPPKTTLIGSYEEYYRPDYVHSAIERLGIKLKGA